MAHLQVLCSEIGTPGAIDNGTGVTVLLLLAELLKDTYCRYPIELLVFNGEDYYRAPGQVKYIEQNEGRFEDILLKINIDGAGYHKGVRGSPCRLSTGRAGHSISLR